MEEVTRNIPQTESQLSTFNFSAIFNEQRQENCEIVQFTQIVGEMF